MLSKCDKKIQALKNNPKNVKFETIQNILISKGFSETTPGRGSSHYTYSKGPYRITVVKDKPVNSIYIKQAVQIIEMLEELS